MINLSDFKLNLDVKGIYRNNKNKKLYILVSCDVISSTNSTAGKKMCLYCDDKFQYIFTREKEEFFEKFVPVDPSEFSGEDIIEQ